MNSIILYSTVMIVTAILAECSVKLKNPGLRVNAFVFMIVIPAFFSSVRYGIGTDYFNYVIMFDEAKEGIPNRIEKGYNLLNYVIGNLGGDAHIGFFVVTALMVLFVYLALYDNREKISAGIGMLVFMLAYYQASFNNVRQLFAISILLFSTRFIFNKQFIRFVFWVIVAANIHSSAYFFLPCYFIYIMIEREKKMTWQFVFWGASMIVVAFADIIMIKIFSLIPFLSTYSTYLESSAEASTSHLATDLLNLPYLIPGIFLYKKLKAYDPKFKFYFMLLVFGFIIQFSSRGAFTDVSIRASIVFFSVFIIVVPYYIRYFNAYKAYFLSYILLILIAAVWWILLIFYKNAQTYPYQWIYTFWFSRY